MKAFAQQLTDERARRRARRARAQDLGPDVPKPTGTPRLRRGSVANRSTPTQPWRSTPPPKPGPTRALTRAGADVVPAAQRPTVLLNERPGVPVVSATLVLKTGSGANPVWQARARELHRGDARRRNHDPLGAADRERSGAAGRVADHRVDGGLDAGVRHVADPHVPADARRCWPTSCAIRAFPPRKSSASAPAALRSSCSSGENANAVASAVTAAALYGPSHPYGYTELGTEASNKGDDGRRHARVLGEELRAQQRGARGLRPDLRGGAAAAGRAGVRRLAARHARLTRRTLRRHDHSEDRAGRQAGCARRRSCAAVSIAAPRATPDYEAMLVLNDTFGGLFSSRINLNLREAHGYTYGANSQFVFRRSPGFFVVATGVRTDVTAPALSEIVKELARIRDGVTRRRAHAGEGFDRPLVCRREFETSSRVTNTTANLFLYDLPLDYYAKAQAALFRGDVGAGDWRPRGSISCRKRRCSSWSATGRRSEPDLEKLNLGPIELWTPDATRTVGRPQPATSSVSMSLTERWASDPASRRV